MKARDCDWAVQGKGGRGVSILGAAGGEEDRRGSREDAGGGSMMDPNHVAWRNASR